MTPSSAEVTKMPLNKWFLLSTVGEFKIDRLAIYIYNNLKHIEKSCSFTYFHILLSSRQDGGLEERCHLARPL